MTLTLDVICSYLHGACELIAGVMSLTAAARFQYLTVAVDLILEAISKPVRFKR